MKFFFKKRSLLFAFPAIALLAGCQPQDTQKVQIVDVTPPPSAKASEPKPRHYIAAGLHKVCDRGRAIYVTAEGGVTAVPGAMECMSA